MKEETKGASLPVGRGGKHRRCRARLVFRTSLTLIPTLRYGTASQVLHTLAQNVIASCITLRHCERSEAILPEISYACTEQVLARACVGVAGDVFN